jgi:SAM-dependent methyltransferase
MSKKALPSQFHSFENDVSLEQSNQIFWGALIDHVKRDISGSPSSILDVGCHHGGLLERLAGLLHPKSLNGIEPLSHCRERAIFRLKKLASDLKILPPERWTEVRSNSVDLLTCHEVLHMVEDLSGLFHQISRTLKDDGIAYIVVGCHTENPVWPRWKAQLQDKGEVVFDHSPLDILNAASDVGMKGILRPLRRDGWVVYTPSQAVFEYSSVRELFDHQYFHKLLFRFTKRP